MPCQGQAGIVHHGSTPKCEDFVKNEFLPWPEEQHQMHETQ